MNDTLMAIMFFQMRIFSLLISSMDIESMDKGPSSRIWFPSAYNKDVSYVNKERVYDVTFYRL